MKLFKKKNGYTHVSTDRLKNIIDVGT